ncbi:MAG TPA: DUF4239 domain-containing protein [Deltaproteobacteria bacterium]|nr:DUF4239 domain-containing protein [Deltaproteobacteria bacterium]HQO60995.1 DUF4239 domain-containing protein [Deltaproteobacteria bacterium]
MKPTAIGILVFACTLGGALAGICLNSVLQEHHLSEDSKDTVKVGIGLIAMMTALVLGLITASAKSSFDTIDQEIRHTAAQVLTLDRVLARYGPETKEIREVLYHLVERRVEMTWPQKSSQAAEPGVPVVQDLEAAMSLIRGLSPQNDAQHWLQSRALGLGETVQEARWVVFTTSVGTSVPAPFLFILLFWLTIIFVSFGLFAPKNSIVITVLLFCALSVAGAVFLILEMGSPFEGLMKISPDALRFALSHMNQ